MTEDNRQPGFFERVSAAGRAFRRPSGGVAVQDASPIPYNAAVDDPPIPARGSIKKVRKLGLSYAPTQGSGQNGRVYEAPLFNLNEVRVAGEVDSFVRRAIQRHIDVFTKSGFYIDGASKPVEYLRRRFAIMAYLTHKPFEIFIEEAASDFVKYHNCFLIKGRLRPGEMFPGMRLRGINGLTPVSGYFKVAPPTMSVARTRIGNEILMWMQTVGQMVPFKSTYSDISNVKGKNPNKILIRPFNMVHFYKDREEGEIFGTPFILPTIPDVKTLREVEQYIVELVYLFSNPIVTWKVGTEDEPGEPADVKQAEEEAKAGPISGMYILPGDQKIEVESASEGVDALGYLQYFENRVFTGLGTSETQMGRGNTANRSTAGSQVEEFYDRIRGYQRSFAAQFTMSIIHEMLIEGGFNPFIPEETAMLVFRDPDINYQVLKENSAVQLYTNYLVTESEARREIGLDPLSEDDRKNNFLHLVKIPLVEAQVDAQLAKAGLLTSSGGNGNGAQNKNKSLNSPSNQHGKSTPRKGSDKETDDIDYIDVDSEDVIESQPLALPERVSVYAIGDYIEALTRQHTSIKKDIIDLVSKEFNKDTETLGIATSQMIFSLAEEMITSVMSDRLWPQFRTGVSECCKHLSRPIPKENSFPARFRDLVEEYVEEWKGYHMAIFDRLKSTLSEAEDAAHATSLALGVFNAMEYLVRFKGKTQYYHARNTGYGWAAYTFGEEMLVVKHFSSCPLCGQIDKVQVAGFHPGRVPPKSTHPNCECEVKVEGST